MIPYKWPQILASTTALPLQLSDISALISTTRFPICSILAIKNQHNSPGRVTAATIDSWNAPPHPGSEPERNPPSISGRGPGASIVDARSANATRADRPVEHVVGATSLANGASRLRFGLSMRNA